LFFLGVSFEEQYWSAQMHPTGISRKLPCILEQHISASTVLPAGAGDKLPDILDSGTTNIFDTVAASSMHQAVGAAWIIDTQSSYIYGHVWRRVTEGHEACGNSTLAFIACAIICPREKMRAHCARIDT
jgi:hypothetical protein